MHDRRPNVLFMITDQQRFDHVGFMGNDVVRTPNLDAIAARGTVFERAFVANPVCMPNRCTIMTGRMPSAHGVIFNDRSLDWTAGTHVADFRRAGWRTGLIGKSHLQHGLSRNAVFSAPGPPAVGDPYPPGWDTLEDSERFEQDHVEWPDDFYGFEHVELSIDHGARASGHHLGWALERGGRYEDLVVPYSDEAPALRRSDRWWQIYQPPYAPELHSTEFVADRTISFIEQARHDDRPWLAWASFPDPHHPMTPPGEWFDRHDPSDVPVPSSLGDPLEHVPAFLRVFQGIDVEDTVSWVGPFGTRDPAFVQEMVAATYGSIEFIDDAVGRILSAVDAVGQLDDTIVVVTSDHGDMMGDHGLANKLLMHYRGCLQVPMVIADPRRPAARTRSLAGSIDLGPTLLDLCDVAGHDGIQGVSQLPALDDPAVSVRDHVLIEEDMPPVAAEIFRIPVRTRTLVMDDGRKLTRHGDGSEMMFDLDADPDEMVELSHLGGAVVDDAHVRMLDALLESSDVARGAPTH